MRRFWIYLRRLMMAVTVASAGVLVVRVSRPVVAVAPSNVSASTAINIRHADAGRRSVDAGFIASRSPFRPSRRPANAPFLADTAVPRRLPPPTAPAAPSLVLRGTLLGPRAGALVEGIPGAEAIRLLSPGDRISGYTLLSVASDSAVLVRGDSVTVIRMRRPAS